MARGWLLRGQGLGEVGGTSWGPCGSLGEAPAPPAAGTPLEDPRLMETRGFPWRRESPRSLAKKNHFLSVLQEASPKKRGLGTPWTLGASDGALSGDQILLFWGK